MRQPRSLGGKMGLVKFELGKVFRNRRVRVLVLVLLILNLPLLFWNIRS